MANDLAIGLRVSLEAAEKIKVGLSKMTKNDDEEDSDELDAKKLGLGDEVGKLFQKGGHLSIIIYTVHYPSCTKQYTMNTV